MLDTNLPGKIGFMPKPEEPGSELSFTAHNVLSWHRAYTFIKPMTALTNDTQTNSHVWPPYTLGLHGTFGQAFQG
jgi:hypothetical protein